MFNKKFKDKYLDVARPIVCNGLREIKPYGNKQKQEVVLEQVEEEVELEPEPEPQFNMVVEEEAIVPEV